MKKLLSLACIAWLLSGMSTFAFGHGNAGHKSQHATAFVALEATRQGPRLIHVDKSDHIKVFYQIPKGDRLHQFSHHPQNSSLIMAYSDHSSGQQGIFTLEYATDAKANSPTLNPMITDKDPSTWLFDPVITPDGKTLFYVSAQSEANNKRADQNLALIRYSVKTNEKEVVGLDATSLSLSESGKYLTWLESNTKILVLELATNQKKEFDIPNPKRQIRSPMVSDKNAVLHLFSNESSLALRIPFISSAWAHPGKQHQDAYGWQFKLSEPKLQNTIKTMEIRDLKATDFHSSGKMAYLDETGIHLYSLDSKETKLRFANHHLWKFRFTKD